MQGGPIGGGGYGGPQQGQGMGGGLNMHNQGGNQFGNQGPQMGGMYGNQGPQSSTPQFGAPPALNMNAGGATSTQKIAIPTITAGCVIGKHGSTIKDIRYLPAPYKTRSILLTTLHARAPIPLRILNSHTHTHTPRMQSGTSISIADPDPATPAERVVTISGSSQGIQAAIFLMRQLVEHFQPPQF